MRVLELTPETLEILTSALVDQQKLDPCCAECSDKSAAMLDMLFQMMDDVCGELLFDQMQENAVREYGEA